MYESKELKEVRMTRMKKMKVLLKQYDSVVEDKSLKQIQSKIRFAHSFEFLTKKMQDEMYLT